MAEDMVTGELVVLDEPRAGYAARPPVFESGAGGLVSTVDDLLAFGRMMLLHGGGGAHSFPAGDPVDDH
jgi:CubicO group peptidase (beta-lactamase class C family)